ISSLEVGHSMDGSSDYVPLVTQDAKARVESYIQQGVDAGAELLADGRTLVMSDSSYEGESLAGGFFTGPTFFDHVTPEMSIYTDEIFGPVLSMVRADTLEEAVKLPTEHEYGNGVAMITSNCGAARDSA